MSKRAKPARREMFGILNPYGDIWSTSTFETEAHARKFISDFWRNSKDIDLSQFKVIRVRVVVSALPSNPDTTQNRKA